jgi:hypothetical protein
MCLFSMPKSSALASVDPNAGKAAAEADMRSRAKASGFASTLKSTAESRTTGTAASKLLLGQ